MFLTITTTHRPATDLGYLLHKNPARAQQFSLSVGTAHVFYPEVSEDRCTAALLVDVDPVDMVRRRRGRFDAIDQYVNDRPYAASSYLAVALGEVNRPGKDGGPPVRPAAPARPGCSARLCGVQRGGVAMPTMSPSPVRSLVTVSPPRLRPRGVQELKASALKLGTRRCDRLGILHLELDRCLRDDPVGGPLRSAKAPRRRPPTAATPRSACSRGCSRWSSTPHPHPPTGGRGHP